MARLLTTLLCAALALTALACSDGNGDPTAGTGSAGGNPLTMNFETEDSALLPEVLWDTPILNIGEVVILSLLTEDGSCVEAEEVIDIEEAINFSSGGGTLTFENAPCLAELRPLDGEGLLSVGARFGITEFDINDIIQINALAISLERPELLEQTDKAIAVFNVDGLLEGFDLLGLIDLLRPENDETRQRIIANLAAAVVLYSDTNEDGQIDNDERNDDNVLARFEAVFDD